MTSATSVTSATNVIVIGGGVIGAATAFRLAQAGARVTLVEAGRLAGGTSGASFAWVNASDKPPLAYHLLNVAGMGEHLLLQHECGGAPWLHLDGNIEWAQGEAATAALMAKTGRLRGWGYAAEWLTPTELHAIEPEIAVPGEVERVVFYPTEGYVDVPALIGALATRAEAAGATIRTGFAVASIERAGGRVTGVVSATGERITADAVVSCTGRWSAEIAALTDVHLPMANTVGLLAVTGAAPVSLRAIITTAGVNIRPDGAGRLRLQATEFDASVTPDTPTVPIPPGAYTALERATAVLPRLAGVPLAAALIGVRAIPDDGHPTVGPVPGIEGLYLVATHSGVTMGPLLGRLIARELLTGEADARLAPFRPARLAAPLVRCSGA